MQEKHSEKFAGVWCPAEVLLSDLNANELRLWLRIRSFQGTENGVCFASNDYLAKDLRCVPTWVSEVLTAMVKKGYIYRAMRGSNKRILRAIFPNELLREKPKAASGKAEALLREKSNIEYKEENTKIEGADAPPFDEEITDTIKELKAAYDPNMWKRTSVSQIQKLLAEIRKSKTPLREVIDAARRKAARLKHYEQKRVQENYEPLWPWPERFLKKDYVKNNWTVVGKMPRHLMANKTETHAEALARVEAEMKKLGI